MGQRRAQRAKSEGDASDIWGRSPTPSPERDEPAAPEKEEEPEPNYLPIALGGAAALAALALLLGGGSKKKQPAALLLGPSNAGKTLLFHRLVNNELEETVASMKSCEGIVDNKLLVDVPGHRRLRNEVTKELTRATKIVFLVDAADATRGGARAPARGPAAASRG